MVRRLHHRGPDDVGVWKDDEQGIVLAHCRLAVIDLSAAGHQPMISPCGRFILAYNGEIYNHHDLRIELEKDHGLIEWRGHSDTETLLMTLSYWGLEKSLERLNGMFAFALWNREDRTLVLARDRMGEKPLYYGYDNGTFLFGSELKSLTAHHEWKRRIDRDALALYMRHNYIPAPWSIYKNIRKLEPAHYIIVRNDGKSISPSRCYWDFNKIAQNSGFSISEGPQGIIHNLESLLRDAVRLRMAADVPLGAFLSGGFDSTAVVALMQAQSQRPIKTFTIGFGEKGYDEAQHAKTVAGYLGTDHTELYVSTKDAMDVIPLLSAVWDEPFSDSSQIPTLLISRLARQHVTVSLSGDGGDELFCGYDRYSVAFRTWRMIRHLPFSLRRNIANRLMHFPISTIDNLLSFLHSNGRPLYLSDRIPKFIELFAEKDKIAFYHHFISHWKNPIDIVIGANEPRSLYRRQEEWPSLKDFREQMMYLDTKTYLPDDILAKVDRASMAVSLETRLPLLDHRVVEMAWRIPLNLKHRKKEGKWLLRQLVYKYVPKTLMDRPKMGFEVPLEHWLRGPLQDWAETLLERKRLREDGFLNPDPIRRMWKEHISGKRRWHGCLWNILMFQEWLKQQTTTDNVQYE